MGKVKILKKQKISSSKLKKMGLGVFDPYDKILLDTDLVKKTVYQALVDGDLDTVQDVLIAHIRTVNKTKLAKKTKLGRQTLYDLLDSKKEFNPSLKTLTLILDNLAA